MSNCFYVIKVIRKKISKNYVVCKYNVNMIINFRIQLIVVADKMPGVFEIFFVYI